MCEVVIEVGICIFVEGCVVGVSVVVFEWRYMVRLRGVEIVFVEVGKVKFCYMSVRFGMRYVVVWLFVSKKFFDCLMYDLDVVVVDSNYVVIYLGKFVWCFKCLVNI